MSGERAIAAGVSHRPCHGRGAFLAGGGLCSRAITTGYTEDHAAAGLNTPLPPLETWHSKFQEDYEVVITIPEFTSICPKTALPDFATITVTYVPDRSCVELKSLKEYLLAYRNLGIFNENVVNRVLADLVAAVAPRRATVRGVFTPRGGIQTTVTASFPHGER